MSLLNAGFLKKIVDGLENREVTFHDDLVIRDTNNHDVTKDLSNLKEVDFYVKLNDFDVDMFVDIRIDAATFGSPQIWDGFKWVLVFEKIVLPVSPFNKFNQFYINSIYPELKNMTFKNLQIRVGTAGNVAPTDGSVTIKAIGKK